MLSMLPRGEDIVCVLLATRVARIAKSEMWKSKKMGKYVCFACHEGGEQNRKETKVAVLPPRGGDLAKVHGIW
jgi:hypothetical protein